MVGKTLGHYRIVEKIGEGGMGVVYRARDERLDRDVALKLLPMDALTDATARERLLREARTASALNHPHICTIHEVGEAEGQAYIAMEYVEGRPLRRLVPIDGLPGDTVARYGAQIADALAHAHKRGIVHRDLKTANVVVTPEGQAKMLDFGLAIRFRDKLAEVTRSQASLAEAGPVAGTLAYMAPEILSGEPTDKRSDIWALGVVLYEMATGTLPFRGKTGLELSSAILREPPAPLPRGVPAGLRTAIQRCLAKEPAQRYEQASEVQAALEALASGTTAVPALPIFRRVSRGWLLGGAASVVLLALLLAWNLAGWRERLLGRARAPRIESLAVLPLENFSHDPEQEYFAEGMTEALITDLAQISGLRVISRTSVMQYKSARKALPEIARELGVEGVVEGTVERFGDRVRITARLIYARSDTNLWAESYERDLRNVLALQDDVARAIAEEIRVKLTPQERMRLARFRPVDRDAYEAYLRGRFFWNKRTPEGLQRGLEFFQQAIVKDPSYAQAYAGLADTYTLLENYGVLPPTVAFPKAKAAALKALALDETLADGHTSLGAVLEDYDRDWAGAEREYKRAIELNPNYETARQWYATLLAKLGRPEEAISQARKARELAPLSLRINTDVGWTFYWARQYDRAIEQFRATLVLDPNFTQVHLWLGWCYLQKGRYEEAIREFQKAVSISERSPPNWAALAYAFAVTGKRGAALEILGKLKKDSRHRFVSAYQLAIIYVGLGEGGRALDSLEKAQKGELDKWLGFLKVEPVFDPLRSNPRFKSLLRRLNFPE